MCACCRRVAFLESCRQACGGLYLCGVFVRGWREDGEKRTNSGRPSEPSRSDVLRRWGGAKVQTVCLSAAKLLSGRRRTITA